MQAPRTATLLRSRPLSPGVRELTFDVGDEFQFVPGQWVNLFVRGEGEPLKRSYSIASPRRSDGTIDLAITRVVGGPMSTLLHEAAPGDTFEMSHAQGFFTLTPPRRNVLLVATGTGVAPFRAILQDFETRELASEEDARFLLLFGARTEADLLYREEWAELARAWPGFEFAPSLSRPDAAWGGRSGYVQGHLGEALHSLGGPDRIDAYVCGLQKMVGDVRKQLRDVFGVPRDRIHHERYD
jgi:ferredoxin-NADP reductase